MSLFWTIYLIDIIDSVDSIVTVAFASLVLGFCLYSWILFQDRVIHQHNDIPTPSKKLTTIGAIAIIFITTLCILIPSKKSLYLMAAVKYSDSIAVSGIPKKALKLLDAKLDAMVSELEKE